MPPAKAKATYKTNSNSALLFNRNSNLKEQGLIVLNQKNIRKKAMSQCLKTLKKIDKAKLEIHQFENKDKPAYDKWIQENFGDQINKIKANTIEIQTKRALIDEVQEEAFLQRITFIEAYRIIKYKKEHPEEFEKPKSQTSPEEDPWKKTSEDYDDIFKDDIDELFRKFNYNKEEVKSSRNRLKSQKLSSKQDFDIRLKEQYRLLAQKLHPDKNRQASQIEKELWFEALEAYKQKDLEKLDYIISLYNIRFGFIGIDSSIFDLNSANSKLHKSLKQINQFIKKAKREPSWLFLKLNLTKLNLLKREAAKEFKDYEKHNSTELKEINNILSKWENGQTKAATQNNSKVYQKQKEDEDFLNFYAHF